jgi:hypothetical protein
MGDVSDIFITSRVQGPVGFKILGFVRSKRNRVFGRHEFGGSLGSAGAACAYEFTGYEHEDLRT